jgi:hypothetical protein
MDEVRMARTSQAVESPRLPNPSQSGSPAEIDLLNEYECTNSETTPPKENNR